MKLVSIIVPVYNVEKYLKKCIDSIVNQTYKNIEILLIDDGATDNSGALCDELAKTDNRIRVIHKPNGGLSDARNVGIENAKGEFIQFIDSDDYIEPDTVEFFVNNIGDADMIVGGMFNEYAHGKKPSNENTEINFETNNIDAYKHILQGEIASVSVCTKMFTKKSIGDIRFRIGKLYEDTFFNNEYMPSIKKVRITTKPLYTYVHRGESITTQKFNKRQMDLIEAYNETLLSVDDMPEIKPYVYFRNFRAHFRLLDNMIVSVDDYKKLDEYKQIKSYLRKNVVKIVQNPYFSKVRKISAIALYINDNLYKPLAIYNKKKAQKLV